jgi:rhamnosyltransferase subunit B
MHVILSVLGTDGDVFPFVGVGLKLRDHGHRITLVAGEPYRGLAERHGLAFEPLITAEESAAWLGHPDFWHPIKTVPLSARWGVRLIDRQYQLLARLAAGSPSVLVAQPAIFAASLVHEKHSVPLVHLLLQPGLIPSVEAPPVMPAFPLPGWAPRPVARLFWRSIDLVGDLLVGRHLNRIRGALGLKPVKRIFQEWWARLVLGLFPSWYGPPQSDWPAQIQLLGFPSFEGGVAGELSDDLAAFCAAGPAPIAFTLGTGMSHGAREFRAALEACALLGARGIFLTRHPAQLPEPLPPFARSCSFAPFTRLFPRCAAVFHHGGVGTTARALAAGTPQLILPLAFDQMDNAARVRRLGAGQDLRSRSARPAEIARALVQITSPATQARCREIAGRFDGKDVLAEAAQRVEEAVR